MSVIGPRPETGLRVTVERPQAGGPPWRYAGEVVTPDARYEVAATVDEGGAVAVSLPPEAPADLAGKIKLIIRAVSKPTPGAAPAPTPSPPPRRIARWRADR